MLKRKPVLNGLIQLIAIIIISCSSQEYTTAKLAVQQSDFTKAAEWFPKAMAVQPDNPEIPVNFGIEIHARNKEWHKVREMFDLAMKINSEKEIEVRSYYAPVKEQVAMYSDEYYVKEFNLGVEEIKKEQSDPDNKVKYLENAIIHFTNSSIIRPKDVNSYINLANAHISLDNFESAKEVALKSMTINSENFDANFSTGQIFTKIGATASEILPYFEKAASLDPKSSNALTRLAQIYYELGRKKEAVKVFENAIKNQDNKILKADLYYNLGVIHNQMLQYEEAEKAYEECAYLNEEDYEALLGMALTYKNWANNYRDGINDFPQDNNKAYSLYRKAEKKMKAAKIIDIDNSDTYNKEIEQIRYLRGTVE